MDGRPLALDEDRLQRPYRSRVGHLRGVAHRRAGEQERGLQLTLKHSFCFESFRVFRYRPAVGRDSGEAFASGHVVPLRGDVRPLTWPARNASVMASPARGWGVGGGFVGLAWTGPVRRVRRARCLRVLLVMSYPRAMPLQQRRVPVLRLSSAPRRGSCDG